MEAESHPMLGYPLLSDSIRFFSVWRGVYIGPITVSITRHNSLKYVLRNLHMNPGPIHKVEIGDLHKSSNFDTRNCL